MRPSYNEPGKQTDRQPARKISDQWVAEKVLLHCTQRSREGMSATKPGTFEKSPQTKRNALDAWWTWCHNSGVTEPHSVSWCLRVRLVLCVMHKLGDKDADKPGRREACRVISTVTQYQHWKLKNAIHVNALKKKKTPAADRRERYPFLHTATMICQTLLVNAACKHKASESNLRATYIGWAWTNVTYRHTA